MDPAIANMDLDPPAQPSVLRRWLVPALVVNALFVVALGWSTPWYRSSGATVVEHSPTDPGAMGAGPAAPEPVGGEPQPGASPAVRSTPQAAKPARESRAPVPAVAPRTAPAAAWARHEESQGPSFDCAKARSRPEKLICADPELARLDRELGRLNVRARSLSPDPVAFRRAGDSEWKRREAECRDKACLLAWFAHRREQLQAMVNARS